MARLYFEDLVPGWQQRSPSYRVERSEIISFAERWDPQPWHVDEAAAEASIFGGLTACATHSMAIQSRLSHQLPDELATLAGLGNEGMRLVAPVRPGDELHLVLGFVEKRRSESKPDRGIVSLRFSLVNQRGETVLTTVGKTFVALRGAGQA